MMPVDDEREARQELGEQIRRKIQTQRAEEAMVNHWERAYGDE